MKKRRRKHPRKCGRKKNESKPRIKDSWARAFAGEDKDRREHLIKKADDLRREMERQSLGVRDLIISQPPVSLLGYLMAKFHMGFLATSDEKDEGSRMNRKELIKSYQLALEYTHAVWSCHAQLLDEATPLDEQKAVGLFEALEELETTTAMYCMASTVANANPERSASSAETEFYAKSSWVLIRGNRYQVLEEEFFRFVLGPHDNALREAYGMGPPAIAAEIQAIANSMRVGFSEAVQAIHAGVEKATAEAKERGSPLLRTSDGTYAPEMLGAIEDIFHGGICNLSRHTNLSATILDDLCYLPGDNTEFFSEGEFKGTPMRTLPARIKPGIKLGGNYYATDGQFIRDSAYRAIQRGLLNRQPEYREEWNRRQKTLVERSFPTIFSHQLTGASVHSEVYFKDTNSGQWVESDLVMVFADVLFIVEARQV